MFPYEWCAQQIEKTYVHAQIDRETEKREKERQRDKETERQRDRETEGKRYRGTEGQRDRGTERQRDRHTLNKGSAAIMLTFDGVTL